jgi:hypothetical protein
MEVSPMSGIWFLAGSNQRLGPFSSDQLKKLAASGDCGRST